MTYYRAKFSLNSFSKAVQIGERERERDLMTNRESLPLPEKGDGGVALFRSAFKNIRGVKKCRIL